MTLPCRGKGTSPTAVDMSRKFSVPVGRSPKGGLMARPPSNQQVGSLRRGHLEAPPIVLPELMHVHCKCTC